MSDDPLKLTNEALEKFYGSLVLNYISAGEAEANVIENGKLTEDLQAVMMKANTLFTVATMYLMQIMQERDLDAMRKVITIWAQPMVQDLVKIAFGDEIKEAQDSIEKAIESMEEEANKNAPGQ